MITLMYRVDKEQQATELEWLREQKIFPGYEEHYDWIVKKTVIRFGVIVSPEQAMLVKLRHNIDFQKDYKQK